MRVWLKHRYQDAAVSGPESKRIKFTDIVEDAESTLQQAICPRVLSRAIKSEFSDTVSTKKGHERNTYIYGLEKLQPQQPEHPLQRENEALRRKVEELEQKVAYLEKRSIVQTVDDQMGALLDQRNVCYHGPNTIDHLSSFSIDAVLEEMKSKAPDLVELFDHLARCERFEMEDEQGYVAQLRATMAVCTLLKGRSIKVLGVQLLLSLMLIARATSKQVDNKYYVIYTQ